MSQESKKTTEYKEMGRLKGLFWLCLDFSKKCTEDHIAAFGAMSSFFILLSVFPFLVLLLTLTKTLPFSKDHILQILQQMISFNKTSLIIDIVNEVYQKTGTTIFTVSVIAALWSSSKGIYAIVRGLNSVYDIEDDRNYFLLRALSTLYTGVFLIVVALMMILWVFGNNLYQYITEHFVFLEAVAHYIIYKRSIFTTIILTILFMCIYKFVPNRKSRFIRQFPGALLASFGWQLVSWGCSFFMEHFHNFTFIYGSMAGIMIILIWLYFCMSMIFYGAECNYFLENKQNYHTLVRTVQPALRALKSRRLEKLRFQAREEKRKRREQRAFQLLIEKAEWDKKQQENKNKKEDQ